MQRYIFTIPSDIQTKILESLNYNWKLHRGGRITASNFHEICHKKVDDKRNQNTSLLLNQLMLYTTTPNVPTITYGQENEKKELGLNIKP